MQAPALAEPQMYASSGYSWPSASQHMQYPAQVPRSQEFPRIESYSQWADQRTLSARNFDFVQTPEDEAGMTFFGQNFEQSRRLSDESRHG